MTNSDVRKCVITVPAYFNDNQKRQTKRAAQIAGLDCRGIINEPTAAALAFTKDVVAGNSPAKKVLIFDFGGGTFDVTVLEIIGRESTVKATTGDSRLGGQDIDKAFMENIIERLKEERGEWEPSTKDKSKIRKACKEAKILLSNTFSTFVNVELGDEDYQYAISRK